MTEKTHRVVLRQVGRAAFEASAPTGGSLVVDGSPEIGGEGRGMRPMELLCPPSRAAARWTCCTSCASRGRR